MQYLTPFPGYRKTLILHRREEELRHSLKHNAPPAKLTKAAERLRTAQLHRIQALQSALADRRPDDPIPHDEVARLARSTEMWEQYSVDDIIAQYKRA